MPLYEYHCDKCSKDFEIIQKFSDAPLTECPECKGAVSKLMSRTSFQLKGTGWYASDYKKPSASSATAAAPAPVEKKPSGGGSCGGGGCGGGIN